MPCVRGGMSTKSEQFKADAQRTGHPHHSAPHSAPASKPKTEKHGENSTGAMRKEQMTQGTPETQARRSIARSQTVRGGKA